MVKENIIDKVEFVTGSLEYLNGFSKMFDTICRERKYLGMQKGLSKGENKKFIEKTLKEGAPFIFVLEKATKNVIGWCDIQIYGIEGKLGIGLIKEYRNGGLGSYIVGIMLNEAKKIGLTKIMLNVRTSNARAIHVYEKFGFHAMDIEDDDYTIKKYNESILLMMKRL